MSYFYFFEPLHVEFFCDCSILLAFVCKIKELNKLKKKQFRWNLGLSLLPHAVFFFLYLLINSCISMFPLRRDPAQSHRDLSVDGRPWLGHWRRLGVDGRFSFQIHQLERRSVYKRKHPCTTKRVDEWWSRELNSLSWPQLYLTGNPDDYYGEDCLSIIINNGYWNDDNCEYKRGYVCKRRGETCCFAGLCWWKVIFRSWCILLTLSSAAFFQV